MESHISACKPYDDQALSGFAYAMHKYVLHLPVYSASIMTATPVNAVPSGWSRRRRGCSGGASISPGSAHPTVPAWELYRSQSQWRKQEKVEKAQSQAN